MERQTTPPRRKDPYRSSSKPKGNPQCPMCKGVSLHGRWIPFTDARERGLKPDGKLLCPACRQEKESYAQGVVELHGESWRLHEEQVLATIRGTEKIARSRNDQQRVLSIRPFRKITKIYVTLPELARHLGRELVRTFKGTLKTHKSSEEPFIRLIWTSDQKRTPMR